MTGKLGRYEILEEIGQGGFAIVYRVRDMELERLVALKELRPILLQDTSWARRFRREARAIARLDHPHIVTIYDVGEVEGRLFIVMRLVDGPSLEELIATQGRFPWPEAVEIITAVAEGLDYAHAQGVLHRDLKPANILMDPERGPMLTDFGLAKLAGESSMSMSASGSVVGTPHYIAPEVWEGQSTTPQSDIYALGCILHEILTGEKIFKGETPPAVMMAHFRPLTLPQEWPEGVPSGVADVLKTALARQPTGRYTTAGKMVKTLATLAVEPELAEPPPISTPETVDPALEIRDRPRADKEQQTAETEQGVARLHQETRPSAAEAVTPPPGIPGSPEDTDMATPEPNVIPRSTATRNLRQAPAGSAVEAKQDRETRPLLAEENLAAAKQVARRWQTVISQRLASHLNIGVKRALEGAEKAAQHWEELPPAEKTGPATSPRKPLEGEKFTEPPPVAEVSPGPPAASRLSASPFPATPIPPHAALVKRKKRKGCFLVRAVVGLGLLVLVIIGAGTLCSAFTDSSPAADVAVAVGPTMTEDIHLSLPDSSNIPDLELNLGAGELSLAPGASEALLEGTAIYNVAQLKPQLITSSKNIRLQPKDNIGFAGHINSELENKWDLKLGSDPMALTLNIEATQVNAELGGLSLVDLTVHETATFEFDLSFSEPNQTKMDALRFKGGASIGTLTGLANTHAEDITFDTGLGVYTLDFSGQLQDDVEVTIASWLSLITVIVPEGVPAQVFVNGRPSSIDLKGAWQESEAGYILPGEGHRITIDVNMGTGVLNLRNQ